MRIKFDIWTLDATERLSDRSLEWSASQYVWEKLDYSLFLLISASPALKKHWCGISWVLNFLSLIHDRFMWTVHEIFHAMFESNEIRFCWVIFVATEAHGEILTTIASLNNHVHESTKPVIEGSSMWFINLFWLFSNERCSHKEYLFKWGIHWKRWFLKCYFIFCLFSPLLLNNVFHDVIYLINTDFIFTLNYVYVEEI